jgi:hypothetical protein
MKIEIKKFKKNHFVLNYPLLSFCGTIKQKYARFSSLKEIKLFIANLGIEPHKENKEAVKVWKETYSNFINN